MHISALNLKVLKNSQVIRKLKAWKITAPNPIYLILTKKSEKDKQKTKTSKTKQKHFTKILNYPSDFDRNWLQYIMKPSFKMEEEEDGRDWFSEIENSWTVRGAGICHRNEKMMSG